MEAVQFSQHRAVAGIKLLRKKIKSMREILILRPLSLFLPCAFGSDNRSSSWGADIYQAEESRVLAYLYFGGVYFYYIYFTWVHGRLYSIKMLIVKRIHYLWTFSTQTNRTRTYTYGHIKELKKKKTQTHKTQIWGENIKILGKQKDGGSKQWANSWVKVLLSPLEARW